MGVASGGTRRIVCAVQTAVLAALILAVPETAHAWFGWLDKFSGPGPFKGVLLDVRVKCSGKTTNLASDGLRRFILDLKAASTARTEPEQLAALSVAVATWKSLAHPAASPAGTQSEQRLGAGVDTGSVDPSYALVAPAQIDILADDRFGVVERVAAAQTVARNIESQQLVVRTLNAIGSEWSLCGQATARRLSVGFGVGFTRASGSDRFANSETISFATFGPSAALRVFSNRTYDVLDLGLSGGVYRFRSKGFKSFGGAFMQPQLNLHFPAAWQRLPRRNAKRLLAALSFRYSRTILLDDLTAAEVNAKSPVPPVFKDRYGVPSRALFLNLQSLLRPQP